MVCLRFRLTFSDSASACWYCFPCSYLCMPAAATSAATVIGIAQRLRITIPHSVFPSHCPPRFLSYARPSTCGHFWCVHGSDVVPAWSRTQKHTRKALLKSTIPALFRSDRGVLRFLSCGDWWGCSCLLFVADCCSHASYPDPRLPSSGVLGFELRLSTRD